MNLIRFRRHAAYIALFASSLPTIVVAQSRADTTFDQTHITYRIDVTGTYEKTWESIRTIESEAGVQRETRFSIPFREGIDSVQVTDAYVIRPEGVRVDADPQTFHTHDAHTSSQAATFSDLKMLTVVFPGLAVRSKVVLRYTLKNQKPQFPSHFSSLDWVNTHSKRLDVRYRYIASNRMNLRVETQGMATTKEDVDGVTTWTATGAVDIPVAPESGSVAAIDYGLRATASTFQSYGEFSDVYSSLAQGRAEPSDEIAALAKQLTRNTKSDEDRARALYEYVNLNIQYIAILIGSSGWVSHPAPVVLQRRYGDCKDQVVLLQALLKAVGIASSPVAINLGASRWLPVIPSPYAFNHVILYVPSLNTFLDPTAKGSAFGVLPFEISDKVGVDLFHGELLATPGQTASQNRQTISTSLRAEVDGRLSGKIVTTNTGQAAMLLRAAYSNVHDVPDSQLLPALLSSANESGTGSTVRPALNRLGSDAVATVNFTLSRSLNSSAAGSFEVARMAMLGAILPFARSVSSIERKLPAVCPSFSIVEKKALALPYEVDVIRVPAGKKLAESTESMVLKYESNYAADGSLLLMSHELTVAVKGSVCSPEDHARLAKTARAIEDDYSSQIDFRPR